MCTCTDMCAHTYTRMYSDMMYILQSVHMYVLYTYLGMCISLSYCPGGPDSDFEYSTQSYTGYEVITMYFVCHTSIQYNAIKWWGKILANLATICQMFYLLILLIHSIGAYFDNFMLERSKSMNCQIAVMFVL